ncbi:PEP-CTERM system histidine kinase PrsK [Altererythrobacter sp. KTW20L]|uniref:XrtA/PEP-CTERM system histidine kinase PrsK n=1 Tax=Altererythrobacter sp. KTW20L TaxID=2942210 RepID=UPI0020BDE505|nr:XrtA/PEP-CTERM system histidine kinase PrsK [Altererythrobacter sp. KTW20L]MCL6251196.1 PEP-CTERM system histidine kinase PrsK [Altererythrobacter sp. KTW20L]
MMELVWHYAAQGSHILAACGAIILALWHASHREAAGSLLAKVNLALALSALWALGTVSLGPQNELVQLGISATYLAWLWLLFGLFAHDSRDTTLKPIRPVVYALAFVEFAQIALTLVRIQYAAPPATYDLILTFAVTFRLLFCIGALVLVHNLYAGAAQQARSSLRWPAAALALLWLFDLNLYTITYLAHAFPMPLVDLRGLAMVVLVALMGYGTVRSQSELRFQPSRSFAFRSFSLGVIGGYLVLMVLIAQAIAYAGSDWSRVLQAVFVLMATALVLALIPSKKVRGWLRVTVAKNLFQHRYDYRAEWLRFTDTIGRAGPQAAPLPERAVQAVADITDSASGLLLTPREEGGLAIAARWNWPQIEVPAPAMDLAGMRFFEESQFILDLDDIRAGRTQDIPPAAIPGWLLADDNAWALVPLLHFERLVGVVVLSRPPIARMLDWEDFDLLRVIGRQLASYLAEQTSQDALGEAQRFDEFNRRIAFVMHDIKNLASQLSLLARNAEIHADKPAFRADMILTLKNSTDKLQGLLHRLGRYGGQGHGPLAMFELDQVLAKVARQYEARDQLVLLDRDACTVRGDAEGLEQALVHLVQNAIEASGEGAPVFLDMRTDGANAVIEVVDSGSGMSPEFIRTRLFRPFHSSKQGGFGIGAFEARELVRAMGGRLDVESREGIGTRFLVRLPLATTTHMMTAINDSTDSDTSGTSAEVA